MNFTTDYYSLAPLASRFHEVLAGAVGEKAAIAIEGLCLVVGLILLYAVLAIILIYMERRVCGAFQCRIGPNRVGGKGGLLQVPADVIKILTKEIIRLNNADHLLYELAPFFVIAGSFISFACLPWHNGAPLLDYEVGVMLVLAASGLGVLGILMAGWSSNSKYAVIGAMRSGAMMISYELSMGIVVIAVVALSGTMSISGIVESQEGLWNLFKGHILTVLAFLIYLISGNAEANRGPFDLAEAEQELTAGYHTEYSGMHFGFFYLAEYLNLFITSGIATTLFLGGWMPFHIPGLDGLNSVMDAIPGAVWFVGKTFAVVFLLMWIRWSFPRLRIDQVQTLEWKYLMPLSLVIMMATVICKVYGWVL